MAAGYEVVSQEKSVQVLGPTRVLDVQTVGFKTHPTGIYAEFHVDWASWLADKGANQLGALAEAIEDVMAQGAAIDAQYVEVPNDQGLIVGYLDVVVEYRPPDGIRPPMTTTIPIQLSSFSAAADPWFARLGASPQSMIADAYAALEATANQ